MRPRSKHERHVRKLILLLILGLVIIIALPTLKAIFSKFFPEAKKPEVKVVDEGPKISMRPVKTFSFSDPSEIAEWDVKVFKGRVKYEIENEGESSHVRATSSDAASALYYKINLDPNMNPVISWRWRVDRFPEKTQVEALEMRREHDFAGRVYVIFPTMFILNSKVLEYIWAENVPVGSTATSPYSRHIRLIVLESGPSKDGKWRFEERDIVADYTKLFGAPPTRNIGAVAFMTNSEHTGTVAECVYDDIKIGYKE